LIEQITKQNLVIEKMKSEFEELQNNSEKASSQKLLTTIEILKREKQELAERLERKSFSAQAELIDNLMNEKQEMSKKLFQTTEEIEKLIAKNETIKQQYEALNNNESLRKLREHEVTIRQLNTVIAELRRNESKSGSSNDPFENEELELINIDNFVNEIAKSPLENKSMTMINNNNHGTPLKNSTTSILNTNNTGTSTPLKNSSSEQQQPQQPLQSQQQQQEQQALQTQPQQQEQTQQSQQQQPPVQPSTPSGGIRRGFWSMIGY
jgi:hypothetical protein